MLKMLGVSAIALGLIVDAVRAEGVMTYGLGRNACGEWLNARRTAPEAWAVYSSWLQGFITAVNDVVPQAHGDVLRGRNFTFVWSWMDEYCSKHPLENVHGAISSFMIEAARSPR
jgi:hypothetical protein